MSYENIIVETRGKVGLVTLNRPKALNALSPELIGRALDALLEGLWLDLMTMAKPYSLEDAKRTIAACLHAFFPKHYPPAGTS